MRAIPLVLLTLALLLGLLSFFWRQASLPTVPDTPEASAELRRTELSDWCHQTAERDCLKQIVPQKPLTVVVFSATWCGPCRSYEAKTLTDPAVKSAIANLGRVLVDIDDNRALSDDQEIKYVPTTILFDTKGREIARRDGGMDPDQFLKWLKTHQH